MPDISVLDVRLHGKAIATLTHLQGDRTIFAFNQEYIEDNSRSTLSLSYKDDLGGLITNSRPTQRVVPPFFSNLLPEGHLRHYLADRAGVNPQRELFLLWMLGQDLPGALSIHPMAGEALPPGAAQDLPSNARPNAYRFSLAGVQLKFSALENSNKRGGLTIPAEGVGGSWIVKLPSQQFAGVPENEFSMMTLAKMIGMDVPNINLIDIAAINGMPEGIGELKGHALAISRFDRTTEGPVHTEDFAQVFGVFPDDKYKGASYASIGRVIGIETGDAGTAEYIRRLVFSALIGNGDMHLKNWSLIYPDRRTAALSPPMISSPQSPTSRARIQQRLTIHAQRRWLNSALMSSDTLRPKHSCPRNSSSIPRKRQCGASRRYGTRKKITFRLPTRSKS